MSRRVPTGAARPLLPIGRIADLQVLTAGHVPAKTQWIGHRFKLHAVGLVVAGRGSYRVDSGPVRPVGPGCAFFVYPGPVFHYGPNPGTSWEERFITFAGNGLWRWQDAGWMWCDGSVRELSSWTELVAMHRQLLYLIQRNNPGDADRAVVLTERLLLEMYYAGSAFRQGRAPDAAMEAVLEYCRAHRFERIDFPALARRHAMSYSSLRQRLRRIVGVSPARYLTHLRCDAARTLLAETDLPIKVIAARVAIHDPYTFSRIFKRCVGMSPLRYRAQQRAWI